MSDTSTSPNGRAGDVISAGLIEIAARIRKKPVRTGVLQVGAGKLLDAADVLLGLDVIDAKEHDAIQKLGDDVRHAVMHSA